MRDAFRAVQIGPTTSLIEALRTIDAGTLQLALVCDPAGRLLGTVTDGDIRRGLIRGLSLDAAVHQVMRTTPLTAPPSLSRAERLQLLQGRRIKQLPIVAEDGTLLGLDTLDSLLRPEPLPNRVVLMAGGLGTRLAPLTDRCPKPLLPVGGKPILERILEHFVSQGFVHFSISVNYRAEMIVDYFGDGSRHGAHISYIHETQRMGTAGALGLMAEVPTEPFIVMNGDLLTKVDFRQMLHEHQAEGAEASMGVREYEFQVPYGVVQTAHKRITGLVEKPVQHFFVNAGIYCLNPSVLGLIPPGQFFDITTLFERLVADLRPALAYPIREYWLDIGQLSDYQRAQDEVALLGG